LIFVDTGAFVARHVRGDQYFKIAAGIWAQLAKNKVPCITSNFVLDETATLIARRAGYNFATQVMRSLYTSSRLEVLRPTQEIELKALDLFGKYADQEVSFTDCTSFVLMHDQRLTEVFSFDRHFDAPGFKRIPLVR
jgi:predicted nucleic acid-binding protein